ncbi:MAG: SDR family NAD(P)-dependent oxidoreductase [Gammaproteobacteria bacterium]|nr:SDR family NAD(P)-dependent oxidoreductase [Gammaproteobacteria bacterium]
MNTTTLGEAVDNPSSALANKVAIVTGANAGLGFETALDLYHKGAKVIVACRSEEKGLNAIKRIEATGDGGSLEYGQLDLSSLDSVKKFTGKVIANESRLDLLINNAGVMIPPASKTLDGFEIQMGVNFVGHFALTGQLFDLLEATKGSRVVTLSSIAHQGAGIDFNSFKLETPYDPWREYGQSKLADLILMLELHKRLKRKGCQLASLAAHPGFSKTELQKNMDEEMLNSIELMTAKEGAQPTLVACLSQDAISGQYWGPDGPGETAGKPALARIDPAALDEALNAKLWDWAEQATGVSFPS